jgi:uncharacterized membrane protein
MGDRLRFLLNRISERLWVKPLLMCVLSIAAALVARAADYTGLGRRVPDITLDSIESLLTIISSSMLLIATFAVGSMVSAYASASRTATPRTFSLVVADDVSQNALSSFIGAFIFSIVALIALKNGYYDQAGRFTLFCLTLLAFSIVILTFMRWVDRIARLGRLGASIDKVEQAAATALRRRRSSPHLGAVPAGPDREGGQAVYAAAIGYVQRIDITALQAMAKKAQARIRLTALPGTFAAPGRELAFVTTDSGDAPSIDTSRVARAFLIGDDRTFDDDPRFGLVVLSEIASRALSSGVNDPGTAIDVIGTLVRLFTLWSEPVDSGDEQARPCDRVEVPAVSLHDMFDDAFTGIARDGAGVIEVAVRLQKAFLSLASTGDAAMRDVARKHARQALARAERALALPDDLEVVRQLAERVTSR